MIGCILIASGGSWAAATVDNPITLSEIVPGLGGQAEAGHGGDLFRHHVDHAFLVLQAAGNDQRRLEVDDDARFFEQRRPANDVGQTGLVLDRNEAESLGPARPL